MSEPSTAPTAPLAEPLVHVESVSIRHDGALHSNPTDVSFTITPGEVVLLLGPSGSGKSTLALALNGLIPQSIPAAMHGTIMLGDRDTASTPVAQLSTRVAMVFQDPDAQLVTGTVLDEVAFGPENLALPVDEVLRRTEAALRQVGLWERRRENPDQLSGGEKQRLAIAAALAIGAPLLVLDEPTANLDPQGVEEVYAALAEIVASGGHSILLVEHNLDAAVTFVTRVIAIDANGTVVADGPVDQVLREQASTLHALGMWLPAATLAALRLRAAGYPLDPLPLTPAELRAGLEACAPPHGSASPQPDDARPLASTSTSTSTSESPLLTVDGLTVRRGGREVLHDVSLTAGAGEFLAIVGANGAGKTSLVQSIAGVIPPPRGTVRLGGEDMRRVDAHTLPSRIGFVFQNPEHQFVASTVYDELAHGLRRQRWSEAALRERVGEMLERFGLADKAGVHPFLLSGGQKRRLSVGTALITGAPIIALDEPTFGQDRARAEELLTLLTELSEAGTTVLVVTHDMQLVAEHADRVIVMAGGRIRAAGTPRDILADEETLRGAGLRMPPLARALRGLRAHPELAGITRLADLPILERFPK